MWSLVFLVRFRSIHIFVSLTVDSSRNLSSNPGSIFPMVNCEALYPHSFRPRSVVQQIWCIVLTPSSPVSSIISTVMSSSSSASLFRRFLIAAWTSSFRLSGPFSVNVFRWVSPQGLHRAVGNIPSTPCNFVLVSEKYGIFILNCLYSDLKGSDHSFISWKDRKKKNTRRKVILTISSYQNASNFFYITTTNQSKVHLVLNILRNSHFDARPMLRIEIYLFTCKDEG